MLENRLLSNSKTLTLKMRPSAQPFLRKWVLFVWEWKMVSISKAEQIISFWYRGPRELGNGLLCPFFFSFLKARNAVIVISQCFSSGGNISGGWLYDGRQYEVYFWLQVRLLYLDIIVDCHSNLKHLYTVTIFLLFFLSLLSFCKIYASSPCVHSLKVLLFFHLGRVSMLWWLHANPSTIGLDRYV